MILLVFTFGCTKLDEKFRDRLVPAAGVGSANPTTLLQGTYNALNGPFQDQATWWAGRARRRRGHRSGPRATRRTGTSLRCRRGC